MFIYQSTNPCNCGGGYQADPDPGCPDTCNCLHLCNISVNALDPLSVGPCGAVGTLDILSTDYGHDTCACGETSLTFTVEYFDATIFDAVTIVGSTLSWTTADIETFTNQYGTVIVKGRCGTLAAYTTILIGIKDMCAETSWDVNTEFCDPCTGIAEPIVPDAILT